jgi:hypothetical protein
LLSISRIVVAGVTLLLRLRFIVAFLRLLAAFSFNPTVVGLIPLALLLTFSLLGRRFGAGIAIATTGNEEEDDTIGGALLLSADNSLLLLRADISASVSAAVASAAATAPVSAAVIVLPAGTCAATAVAAVANGGTPVGLLLVRGV